MPSSPPPPSRDGGARAARVGSFAGFWGDSAGAAAAQLAAAEPPLDFLVGDYLAELTMGLLASRGGRKGRGGRPTPSHIAEFGKDVWAPLADGLLKRGTRVVVNAGGMDPLAAKAAIEAINKEAGRSGVVVAAVAGDDLRKEYDALVERGRITPFAVPGDEAEAVRAGLLSCNAYLGAAPIKAALDAGAHVVVTGRVVDTALVLGPLAHAFGWDLAPSPNDAKALDRLATASLAGHVIECGVQCAGGNFTDWRLAAASPHGGWANVGYPIATVPRDGLSFEITKPPRTGGYLSAATVGEQILYEIGDPAAYVLPDVVVDVTHARLEERRGGAERGAGAGAVVVRGVRGRPAPPQLKTSGTYVHSLRTTAEIVIVGPDAVGKARAVGDAILRRVSRLAGTEAPFDATRVDVVGDERSSFGETASGAPPREVVLRLAVEGMNSAAHKLLARELAPSSTCMAPGICGLAGGGRPRAVPSVRHASSLVDRECVTAHVAITGNAEPILMPCANPHARPLAPPSPPLPPPPLKSSSGHRKTGTKVLPLVWLAYARSGDKGDSANIGVIARRPEYYPVLCAALTEETVAKHMAHQVGGAVMRYLLPGMKALNFVLCQALGGGGLGSSRVDRQGKAYAQVLLTMPVEVPADLSVPRPVHAIGEAAKL